MSIFQKGLIIPFLVFACNSAPEKLEDTETSDLVGLDKDGDGIAVELDCDDLDPTLGDESEDADCDGARTAEDCNDDDPTLNLQDVDADGYSTCAGDCDDGDATLNLGDVDLDGYSTCAGDCDDEDATLNLDDVDLDGYSSCENDCDDQNDDFHPGGIDAFYLDRNCDGFSSTSLGLSDYKLVGENPEDVAYYVAGAGDIDGDGLDDILVGASGNDEGGTNAGAIYIVLASSLGSTSTIELSQADYKLVGENVGDLAGTKVSGGGDIDGDGLNDILVNSFNNDEGGLDAGGSYIILGASLGTASTIDLSQADYKLVGEMPSDQSGNSLSFAGDVDGDGLDDILVNADRAPASGGIRIVYLILGSSLGSSSTINLSVSDYMFIEAEHPYNDPNSVNVVGAGDVDGDGLDDILLGAWGNATGGRGTGCVYIFLGASLGSVSTIDTTQADYQLVGEWTSDLTGQSLASAGDVDGDGLDDIIVGSEGHYDNEAGSVYIILGSSLGSTSIIDLSNADYEFGGEHYSAERAGRSVAGAGDIDGDGLDDILVGAPFKDDLAGLENTGGAYIILGASLPSLRDTFGDPDMGIPLWGADHVLFGEDTNAFAGWAVSGAGDVNGDGLDDIIVGAPYYTNDGTGSGSSYLILSGE